MIFVLTNVELGWDCVCGVFRTKDDILSYLNEDKNPEGHQDFNPKYDILVTDLDDSDSVYPYIVHEVTLYGE